MPGQPPASLTAAAICPAGPFTPKGLTPSFLHKKINPFRGDSIIAYPPALVKHFFKDTGGTKGYGSLLKKLRKTFNRPGSRLPHHSRLLRR